MTIHAFIFHIFFKKDPCLNAIELYIEISSKLYTHYLQAFSKSLPVARKAYLPILRQKSLGVTTYEFIAKLFNFKCLVTVLHFWIFL